MVRNVDLLRMQFHKLEHICKITRRSNYDRIGSSVISCLCIMLNFVNILIKLTYTNSMIYHIDPLIF